MQWEKLHDLSQIYRNWKLIILNWAALRESIVIFVGVSFLCQLYYVRQNALQTKKPTLFQHEHLSGSICFLKKLDY